MRFNVRFGELLPERKNTASVVDAHRTNEGKLALSVFGEDPFLIVSDWRGLILKVLYEKGNKKYADEWEDARTAQAYKLLNDSGDPPVFDEVEVNLADGVNIGNYFSLRDGEIAWVKSIFRLMGSSEYTKVKM